MEGGEGLEEGDELLHVGLEDYFGEVPTNYTKNTKKGKGGPPPNLPQKSKCKGGPPPNLPQKSKGGFLGEGFGRGV